MGRSVTFGQVLDDWLQIAGREQKDLADQMHMHAASISRWKTGSRRPGRLQITLCLNCLYAWLKEQWTVPEALDWIQLIGYSWEDVEISMREDLQQDGTMRSFRKWWLEARPQPLPVGSATPVDYVERDEILHLQASIPCLDGYRQPEIEGVVIRGIAGAGKTTLVQRLLGGIVEEFRDGALWLDGSAGDLATQACRRIAWARGQNSPMSRAEWETWFGASARRLLVIVDDLAEGIALRDILAHKGPQVVVVVTTQRGADTVYEMLRWLPDERVVEISLGGLREEEGRAFVSTILGKPLEETEWSHVEKIGERIGWHPEGLRLAAQMAQNDLLTWRDVTLDLQDVEGSTVLARLERWVDRHWRRMEPQEQAQAQRLLYRMERGGPFGVLFASTAWDVEMGQARVRLSGMERNGLIEQMAGHPVEAWWSEGGRQWQVLPVVYRVKGRQPEKDGSWWRKVVGRVRRSLEWGWHQRLREVFPKMPVSFGIIAAGALLCFAPLKAVIEAVLILGDSVWRGWGYTQRWNAWTIVNRIESHLKRRWDQMGWQPTEELWLLYKQNNLFVYVSFLIETVAFIFLLSWVDSPESLFILIPMFLAGFLVMYRGAWRIWVAGLYGVYTWDLALMLRISLWIARCLRWVPALRWEQDILREVLDRVTRNDG